MINIYSSFIALGPVIHSIKEVNKIASNKEIFYNKNEDLIYILKVEINTATDSITIAGIKTLLNIVSIAF